MFATDIAHANLLREAFRAAGVRCDSIDSKGPDEQVRADAIAAYRAGTPRVLVNVGILSKVLMPLRRPVRCWPVGSVAWTRPTSRPPWIRA